MLYASAWEDYHILNGHEEVVDGEGVDGKGEGTYNKCWYVQQMKKEMLLK